MSNHARDWPEPSRNNQSRSTTAVVPKRGAIYNAQVRRELLRFFNIPLKNIFKISSNLTANCCVSPPGPANYICSPQDAATLKRLGNTAKGWEALHHRKALTLLRGSIQHRRDLLEAGARGRWGWDGYLGQVLERPPATYLSRLLREHALWMFAVMWCQAQRNETRYSTLNKSAIESNKTWSSSSWMDFGQSSKVSSLSPAQN